MTQEPESPVEIAADSAVEVPLETAPETSPETSPEAPAAALPVDYILVALDLSPHSAAALAAAAQLAALLQLELRGLYVEDVDLLHLCGLPFGFAFGAITATPQRIEQASLEREFRVQAALLRKAMADAAGRQRVAWSFQVVRGSVTEQLLAASAAAQMVSLGRVGRSPGKRTGSTAQAIARRTQRPVVLQSRQRTLAPPFLAVDTGSAAADHAVQLGIKLAAAAGAPLTLLVYGDAAHAAQLAVAADAAGVAATLLHGAGLPDLLGHLGRSGVVILPVEVAAWLDAIPLTVIVTP